MRNYLCGLAVSSLLLVGACSSANQGGAGLNSRIPAEPMPGSPAAQMQQQQSQPSNPTAGGGSQR